MVMKHLASVLFAVVFAAVSPAAAQSDDVDREKLAKEIEARVQTVSERLDLTEAQKPEIEGILRDSIEQRMAILKSFGIEEGSQPKLRMRQARDLRSQLQALSEKTTAKLAGVLTDKQMSEYAKIQEEQRAAMREKIQNR